MNFKAVLFDLDGTLLNTLDDLADSMNAVLAKLNLPTHSAESYRYFVGDGIRNLAFRVLPPERRDESTVTACLEMMGQEYSTRWSVKTRPYPGVEELLTWLDKQMVKYSVLSNKKDNFTRMSVDRMLPNGRFSIVRGHVEGVPLKPDPGAACGIAREMDIDPADFLYLGDTATDMKTALSAGMCPAGALWGFRTENELVESGAIHIVERPEQVRDLF